MTPLAINELTIRAETLENNAPIHEAEGNYEQAALCRSTAEQCRDAIQMLEALPVIGRYLLNVSKGGAA